MFAFIGPARYRATRAATSSKEVGASERMRARMGPPPEGLQPRRDVGGLPCVAVGLGQLPQRVGVAIAILVALGLVQTGVQRRVPAHEERRHELGKPVANGRR